MKHTRHIVALVALSLTLGSCFLPGAKPADYDARHDPWRPEPEGGTYAPTDEAPPTVPDRLAVTDAVAVAVRSNPSLQIAFDRVEAAKARVAGARSAYLPSVDAVAGYGNTFESPSLGGFSFGLEDEAYTVGLQGTWLLFDGLAREYRVAAARHGVEESRALEADAQRLLRQAVEGAYYDAIGALENVAIAEADLAFERELLDETAKREAVGAASLSDKLNFEVRVEAAKGRLAAQQSRVETLRVALAELLGLARGQLPERVELVPLGEAQAWTQADPDPETLVDEALRRRPDLAATVAAEARAEAEIGVADSDWFPALNLVGEAGRRRIGNARFASEDTETGISLEARWNLFRGGSKLAARREAVANKRAARAERARLRNVVIGEIRRTVEAVRNAQRQLVIARRALALTRRSRDLVRKEYEAGNASLVRMNEVQRDYVVAQANLTSQRVALLTAWSAVDAAVGRVPPSESR